MKWEDDFLRYINKLNENKPTIVCGDLNVAHQEIDLKNPKQIQGQMDLQQRKEENLLIL